MSSSNTTGNSTTSSDGGSGQSSMVVGIVVFVIVLCLVLCCLKKCCNTRLVHCLRNTAGDAGRAAANAVQGYRNHGNPGPSNSGGGGGAVHLYRGPVTESGVPCRYNPTRPPFPPFPPVLLHESGAPGPGPGGDSRRVAFQGRGNSDDVGPYGDGGSPSGALLGASAQGCGPRPGSHDTHL